MRRNLFDALSQLVFATFSILNGWQWLGGVFVCLAVASVVFAVRAYAVRLSALDAQRLVAAQGLRKLEERRMGNMMVTTYRTNTGDEAVGVRCVG